MTGYDPFAKFYDAVMGEPTETATLLEALIQEFHPTATHVLELACGTGAVLKHLCHTYQVVGLDLSEGMLEVARRNVPDVPFYQDDMSTFHLPLSFDVIYCVFDSVNHLSTWEKWQSLFRHVDQHLSAQGLFIFDINTLFKLERLAQAPTEVQEFAGNYLLIKVTQTENDLYNWQLQVFEQVGNDLYRRHETTILETSFPWRRFRRCSRKASRSNDCLTPAIRKSCRLPCGCILSARSEGKAARDHKACSTRWRSKANPALPYISEI